MDYLGQFSILRSRPAPDAAATIPPEDTALQAQFATAAGTDGAPSPAVDAVLDAFAAGPTFAKAATSQAAASALTLNERLNDALADTQPKAKLQAIAKDIAALASRADFAAEKSAISDSLLVMHWRPRKPDWKPEELFAVRRVFEIAEQSGRGLDVTDSKSVEKKLTAPVRASVATVPLRIRPSPVTAAAAPAAVGGGRSAALANLRKQRTELRQLERAVLGASLGDLKLETRFGPPANPAIRGRITRAATTPSFTLRTALTQDFLTRAAAVAPTIVPKIMSGGGTSYQDILSKIQSTRVEIANNFAAMSATVEEVTSDTASPGSPGSPGSLQFAMGAPPQSFLPGIDLIRMQDFFFIRQVYKGYKRGEISHIENVMQGETLTRTFSNQTTTEDSTERETTQTSEEEKDLTTNDRETLQRETSKSITSEASVKAGFHLGYSGAGVEIATDLSASYQRTEQDSLRAAQSFTREVTARARQKLTETVREKRIRKVTNVLADTASHVLSASTKHVSGIYQFVDKLYDLETYQYDTKVVIDVLVPEPSALYLERFGSSTQQDSASGPPPFSVVLDDIDVDTYLDLGARFGVNDLQAPPIGRLTISKALSQEAGTTEPLGEDERSGAAKGEDLKVPDGYYVHAIRCWATIAPRQKDHDAELQVRIGDTSMYVKSPTGVGMLATDQIASLSSAWEQGSMSIAATASNAAAFSVAIEIDCYPNGDGRDAWRRQVYQALRAAHEQKVHEAANDRRLRDVLGETPRTSPGTAAQIVREELKRSTVELVSAQHFDWTGAIDDGPGEPGQRFPQINASLAAAQADYIQFFELAFDWTLMQFVPYPYFWARKERWPSLMAIRTDDPEMDAFLSAGAVRVVVPLREGWIDFVEEFFRTGTWPTQADLLSGSGGVSAPSAGYVMASQQLKEIKAQIPAGGRLLPDIERIVVPTNMVILSPDTDLPPAPP